MMTRGREGVKNHRKNDDVIFARPLVYLFIYFLFFLGGFFRVFSGFLIFLGLPDFLGVFLGFLIFFFFFFFFFLSFLIFLEFF